jgi:CRISPR-associated protein Cmr1
VRLRLSNESLEAPISPGEILERGRLLGLHYLGYGVMEAFDGKNTKAGRLRRAMIPGGQFTVSCRFSRFAETDQIDEVRRALILLGTVGGLGSKSRKGFGSLTLTSLTINGDEQQLPHSVQERLASVLYERQDGLPDWTAWSSSARVVVTTSEPSSRAIDALDALGREQVLFRSWGSNNRGKLPEHQTIEIPSEQNFAFDHDLFKKKVKGDYPHRVAFGLPHNYGKYDDQHVTTTTKTFGRRASPLLIHIDQAEVTSSAVVSKGGPDDLWNLQPLQWENNRGKSDNWPNWSCTRRAS